MRGIIDAIYWRLHASYLKNHRDDAGKYLAMLEDEIKGDYGKLSAEVGPHIVRYRMMAEEIKRGRFGSLHGGYSSPIVMFDQPVEPTCLEKEFHKVLMTDPAKSLLFTILRIPNDAMILHEAELGEYGRCDFLVRFFRKVFLIEVKMGEAPSYVPSQIERYRCASELDMCLGLHDEVLACVLAESFGQYVLQKLSESGVVMVKHFGRADDFRLLKGNFNA